MSQHTARPSSYRFGPRPARTPMDPQRREALRRAPAEAHGPAPVDAGPPLPAPTRDSRPQPPPSTPSHRHGFWQPLDSAWRTAVDWAQAMWRDACAAWHALLAVLGLRPSRRP